MGNKFNLQPKGMTSAEFKEYNRKQKVGQTKMSNDGTLMKIVEYHNSSEILIEFQDSFKYQVWVEYNNFKKGIVKNPYCKLLYNIGYIGVGPYEQTINRKATKAYDAWRRMFDRCYSEKYHKKYPTYEGCQVCDEWHNFQNFAKWFYSNYYEIPGEHMQVDKDWLYVDNKIYCPERCCIAPHTINAFLSMHSKVKYYNMPIGVHIMPSGNYQARCQGENGRVTIGTYSTIKEAETAYWKFKINYADQLAEKYKEYIPDILYFAIKDYKNTFKDRVKKYGGVKYEFC